MDESNNHDELPEEANEKARRTLLGIIGLIEGTHDKCIHCEQPIEELKQDGRSVYAHPCGCRQYQGELPSKKQG